ncbi:diaminobutyrate acetyltransferase [Yunchengibacter salinarum]|uniref:diaminobutyrate acetyltransferase n=1 Tax=Yunchengibacter salinarum TaxID=3133399 RepID=UPI0035B59E7D
MADKGDADLTIRAPKPEEGMAVHRLIESCPPLDRNSAYCNLLQTTHFAGTSAIALLNGDVVGFVSGYLVPGKDDTLFIWQVAVSEAARGLGLGKRLMMDILRRPAAADVRYQETTITEDNAASWGMFKSLARDLKADWTHEPFFERDRHFYGEHDSEILMRIGPFDPPA